MGCTSWLKSRSRAAVRRQARPALKTKAARSEIKARSVYRCGLCCAWLMCSASLKGGVTAGSPTQRSEHCIADFQIVRRKSLSAGDDSIRPDPERSGLPGSQGCDLFHTRQMHRRLFFGGLQVGLGTSERELAGTFTDLSKLKACHRRHTSLTHRKRKQPLPYCQQWKSRRLVFTSFDASAGQIL